MHHCSCGLGVRWRARADALFDVAGVHVLGVVRETDRLVLTVESDQEIAVCPTCGVVAVGPAGELIGSTTRPVFGADAGGVAQTDLAVRRADVSTQTFSETHPLVVARTKVTTRAVGWAVDALTADDTTVSALARHPGVD